MSMSPSAASGDEIPRPLSSPPSKPAPPATFASSSPVQAASALPPPPPPPPPAVATTPPPPPPPAVVATTPPPPPVPVAAATTPLPPAYSGYRQPERTSGWEKVDKVASTGEAVVNGIGTVIVKLYGLGLIIVGIIVLVALNNPSRFFGLLLIAYGIYLVAPGSKFVIY